MKDEKLISQKSEENRSGIFDRFAEIMGWFQIAASPLLIGAVTGGIIYVSNPSTTRLIVGIIIASIGLLIGIIWATKNRKGKGTIWFVSRVTATPELDNPGKKYNQS